MDNGASSSDIEFFRGLSVAYRAGGLSWWDFAWASARGMWPALSGLYTSVASVRAPGVPVLRYGSAGDMVLWMQELLKSAIHSQRATGTFASETQRNLRSFQIRHGIPPTGETGPRTWRALLRLPAARVQWATADVPAARGARAGSHRRLAAREPQSASLPARAYEILPSTEP
jgi:hypothetical protein